MNPKKEKMNAKLKQLGQRLGMNEMDTLKSKKTMKIFMATRLDPAGLYYMPPSIKDFSLLGRWF